jgi:protein gp37
MSDFFDERVPDHWRDQLVEVMRVTPQHQYQILAKRAREMVHYCDRVELPSNTWLGVSVETAAYLDRVELLRAARASGPRFLSIEPMLDDFPDLDLSGIAWLITGGESGEHLRDLVIRARRGMADPPLGKPTASWGWVPRADRIPWMRHLRDSCIRQGVAFFLKQFGGIYPDSAGHVLDGRTWEEHPRYAGSDGRWHDR